MPASIAASSSASTCLPAIEPPAPISWERRPPDLLPAPWVCSIRPAISARLAIKPVRTRGSAMHVKRQGRRSEGRLAFIGAAAGSGPGNHRLIPCRSATASRCRSTPGIEGNKLSLGSKTRSCIRSTEKAPRTGRIGRRRGHQRRRLATGFGIPSTATLASDRTGGQRS
jgi:hypothetical protein